MARSRLAKIGTIHSRTTGLLRAGAMKEEDKPLWLDIYEAFPPRDEPRFDRPESKTPIKDIFYEEDIIRAKYHKDHRNLPFVRLDNYSYMTQTQKFIAAYKELRKEGIDESELYSKAVLQTTGKTSETEQAENTSAKNIDNQKKSENIKIDIHEIFKD